MTKIVHFPDFQSVFIVQFVRRYKINQKSLCSIIVHLNGYQNDKFQFRSGVGLI